MTKFESDDISSLRYSPLMKALIFLEQFLIASAIIEKRNDLRYRLTHNHSC